jgi:hypothetical protein
MRTRLAPLALLGLSLLLAACSAARPPVSAAAPAAMLTRAEWGANAPVAPMQPHRIRWITIHHTATRQQPARSLEEKMRALQNFSQTDAPLADGRMKLAWPDIPYHYYVDHAGQVAEGRDVRYAGDTNTSYDPAGHLLIVLEGSFGVEEPTAAQLATLERLVVGFARQYGVPAERIDGHKDHADTACPGTHLYELLPALRAKVASR